MRSLLSGSAICGRLQNGPGGIEPASKSLSMYFYYHSQLLSFLRRTETNILAVSVASLYVYWLKSFANTVSVSSVPRHGALADMQQLGCSYRYPV